MKSIDWKPGPLIIERPMRRIKRLARELPAERKGVEALARVAGRVPRWVLENVYHKLLRAREVATRFA